MKRKGINPKAWFYGLRNALAAEQNRPCVLAGAACEQWINSELFRVVARGLDSTTLTAYPEWNGRQHDIAVLPYRPDEATGWQQPEAVIECKVLYSNYSAKKCNDYVERLLQQLSVNHVGTPVRVGFLIGVFSYWPAYQRSPRKSFREFRAFVGSLLRSRVRQGLPGFSIHADHEGVMETFLSETKSKIGSADVVVGCVGQYIRLVPTSLNMSV